MDFRILGALEVWSGSDRVPVSGRSHPKVLAGLLLNAGRSVSVSWLAGLLWDDDPPETARRQVQNTVAALRRQLAPARGDLVERVGQGYRVNITDDELDLRRFELGARKARRLAETANFEEALASFEAVLGLWQGSALSGLTGRVLAAAATRLDDMYVATYEEYARVALELGGGDRIAGKLHELVAEYPLRQRLVARLMHALYQSRRVPEALQLFESTRTRLAEELGIDPGTELKDLHIRVLRDDPALRPSPATKVHASAAPRAQTPIPAQLPTDIATFTGRDENLTVLDRLWNSGSRTCVLSAITGIGGVGKTALAVRWSHKRRHDFPDGQLYINLRGFDERKPLGPHEAVSRLLRSLGHPGNGIPTDLEEASALYQSLLADKRMLVLLDNARTTEQVLPLLPDSPGCLTVITSRNRLSSLSITHDAKPIELDALSPSESLDLLANLLGPKALADITATKRVAELCGQLPLALRIIGANLSQNPQQSLGQLAVKLKDGARLSHLNVDGDSATNLTAVFDLSYYALSEDTQHIFRLLGLIPGDDFTVSLAAAMTDMSPEKIQAAFQELETAHLLDQHRPGRFRFHDLVRHYAHAVAAETVSEPSRTDAVRRMIDWHGDWSNQLFEEFNNMIAICDSLPDHVELWRLVKTFGQLTDVGHSLEMARQRAEHALRRAERSRNRIAEMTILSTLGGIYCAIGDKGAGLEASRTAVSLLSQDEGDETKALVLGGFGNLLHQSGRYAEAESYFKQSLAVAVALNDRRLMLVRSANLGNVYRTMGRFKDAQSHLERALAIAEEDDLTQYRATVNSLLGGLYFEMGKYDDALTTSRRGLEIARQVNAQWVASMALRQIGRVAHVQGRSEEAVRQLNESLEISRHENRGATFATTSLYLADILMDLGEARQAQTCLSVVQESTPPGQFTDYIFGDHSRISCRTLSARGLHEQAIQQGLRACSTFRDECENLPQLARSLNTLGDAYHAFGDRTKALDYWTEALDLFTKLAVPEAAALRAKLDSQIQP